MIYLAKVKVNITKSIRGGKFTKENICLDMVYKDGEEKKQDSYFIQCLEKYIGVKFDKKESYKIDSIIKIKPIGFNE